MKVIGSKVSLLLLLAIVAGSAWAEQVGCQCEKMKDEAEVNSC